ncbi:MAG: hypothetical protein MJZ90_00415 [Bacteroidales bacterium]|nr:hypothetical protein [Bacteroidales bacterium]
MIDATSSPNKRLKSKVKRFLVLFNGLREIREGGVEREKTEAHLKIQNQTKDEKKYQIIYDIDGVHGDGAVRVVQEGQC